MTPQLQIVLLSALGQLAAVAIYWLARGLVALVAWVKAVHDDLAELKAERKKAHR